MSTNVNAGESFTVEVSFKAPKEQGRYKWDLQMETDGTRFGEVVWCDFIVADGQAIDDKADMENVQMPPKKLRIKMHAPLPA